MKQDADVYVGIRDVVSVRKGILTGSKNVLGLLKNAEAYSRLRAEKLQHVMKLHRVMGEIAALNRKLKAELPKVVFEKEREPVSAVESEKIMRKPAKSKLDILEEELQAIESRLSALS